jgi:tetratricopeptide (TPR) repeat protein
MLRTTVLAALAALIGLVAAPAQAQTPDSTQTTDPGTSAVSPEDANRSRVLFNEGFELLGQGDYEAALAKFEEGLALDPSNNRNAFGRAMALAQLDRQDEAFEAFDQAIALSEAADDAETLGAARRAHGLLSYSRAMPLLEASPLPQEAASEALPLLAVVEGALPLLQEAGDETVNANALPYQLARVHNVLGNYEDAVRYAEQAVQLNEGAADMSAFYIELGLAHRGAGNIEGARAAFEQARTGAWGSWAEHYLRELDAAGAGGTTGG